MKEVNSVEELYEYILSQTELAMSKNDGLVDYIVNAIKFKIDEMVYFSYSPKIYERTFELRDSIKCLNIIQETNEVKAEINHNLDLIHSYYPNKHHSVNPHSTGDVSKFIPEIVINNQVGFFIGYGADGRFHNIGGGRWRVPKPYFRETIQYFDRSNNHINKMFEILRNNGNQVEII